MIFVVIGAEHSGARDPAQVHSGDPQVMDESLHGRTSFAYAVWYVAVLRTNHTARALEAGSGQYVRGISLAILPSQCTSISGSKCD